MDTAPATVMLHVKGLLGSKHVFLEPCCFFVAPAAWLWVRCFSSICETAVIYLLGWTSCAIELDVAQSQAFGEIVEV